LTFHDLWLEVFFPSLKTKKTDQFFRFLQQNVGGSVRYPNFLRSWLTQVLNNLGFVVQSKSAQERGLFGLRGNQTTRPFEAQKNMRNAETEVGTFQN